VILEKILEPIARLDTVIVDRMDVLPERVENNRVEAVKVERFDVLPRMVENPKEDTEMVIPVSVE